MTKVIQNLWFERGMEAAIGFYTSLIPGSSIDWTTTLVAATQASCPLGIDRPTQRGSTTAACQPGT